MHRDFHTDAISRREVFSQLNDPELMHLQELADSGQLQDAESRRLDRILAKLYDEALRASGLAAPLPKPVQEIFPDDQSIFDSEDLFPPADAFEDY
uniref:Uncharacterized protein n=1 Tax=Magnetococcus massalia (strain MO-1) TaxID=451514 RepID=A0A1S7LLP4_MAGMO|nr:conserved protein of unknown function [Candidatus Magnetococcus massalia]